MKKLLRFLKHYKVESILGPLFKLLEASFELFIPLVVADIIDSGIANSDKNYVVTHVLIMALLGLVGFISSVTAQYFAAKAATGFATELRHALFEHIQGLSFSSIDKAGTSSLINRLTSDVNAVQGCVNMVLRLFLRSPFIVFGAMIMAFTVDVKCALIFCVAIPLLMIVVFGILLASMPLYTTVQSKLDRILRLTRENLNGIRVIRVFGKEQDEVNNFNARNDELRKVQIVSGKLSALMNPITFVIINAAMVVLIYTGAVRVDNGILTQGQVVALVNYMSQILVELIKLANLIIQVTKAMASANRITQVFDMKSNMQFPESTAAAADSDAPAVIEFKNVSLAYNETGDAAVSDINFTVKRGQTIGIIGGTGSGKSTIVNMIPRFYDATAGEVIVDGLNVKDYAMDDIRSKAGIVLQKAVLFKGTIRDNIKWGKPDATDEEIIAALKKAQAWEFVEEKEGRLDYELNTGATNLSGGQRQRLSIARALVRDPEILILDDSSSALDYVTDSKLRNAIKDYTMIIVSQRITSIAGADNILVLDDGRICGQGTHDELLKTCDVYREIYDIDMKTNSREVAS